MVSSIQVNVLMREAGWKSAESVFEGAHELYQAHYLLLETVLILEILYY